MTQHQPMPIVVLISGNGTNLQVIIDAIKHGDINAEIKAVISSQANAYGLERARQAGIPAEALDHAAFPDRLSFDRELMRVIDVYKPELIVLAGFMRILSDEFIERHEKHMLNIHPSLLPKYRGLNTHQRALDAKDKLHGCSVHFVTRELDGGPVVIQAQIPIMDGDDVATLATRVQHQEHIIYPLAISWFCSGRITLENDCVLIDNKPLTKPIMADELPIKSYSKNS